MVIQGIIIEQLRQLKQLELDEFCKQIQLNESDYNAVLDGKQQFTAEQIKKIASILNCKEQELNCSFNSIEAAVNFLTAIILHQNDFIKQQIEYSTRLQIQVDQFSFLLKQKLMN